MKKRQSVGNRSLFVDERKRDGREMKGDTRQEKKRTFMFYEGNHNKPLSDRQEPGIRI